MFVSFKKIIQLKKYFKTYILEPKDFSRKRGLLIIVLIISELTFNMSNLLLQECFNTTPIHEEGDVGTIAITLPRKFDVNSKSFEKCLPF